MMRAVRFHLTVVGILAAALAGAQTSAPSPTLGNVPPPQAWDSPQATVQTFVSDMRQGNTRDACKALDLSDVPFPIRDVAGDHYSAILIAVLARIHGFRPEALPDQPKGDTYTIDVVQLNGKSAGTLTMERDPGGIWQFDPATVTKTPRIFKEIRRQPETNEIGSFPDPPPNPSMEIRASIPKSLSFLLHSFLWLELWQWVGLVLVAAISILVAWIVRKSVGLVLRFFFRHWEKQLLPASIGGLRRSAGLAFAVIVWASVYRYLGLQDHLATLIVVETLLKLMSVIAGAWVLDAVFDIMMDTVRSRATILVRRADQILIPIAKKFVRFIIIICAGLSFAASMSVNVTGLVAGLGIGGLVIALAGKDSVENIFGSLTIIFDMPFGIGDWVKMNGTEGSIEEINLRSTRIRTANDTLVTVPNSKLITASVENFGARRHRRFNLTLPISYTSDFIKVQEFLKAAREQVVTNPKVQQDNAKVRLNAVSDSSLGVLVEVFFDTEQYSEELELREELLSGLIELAADHKVILGNLGWNPVAVPDGLDPVQAKKAPSAST